MEKKKHLVVSHIFGKIRYLNLCNLILPIVRFELFARRMCVVIVTGVVGQIHFIRVATVVRTRSRCIRCRMEILFSVDKHIYQVRESSCCSKFIYTNHSASISTRIIPVNGSTIIYDVEENKCYS